MLQILLTADEIDSRQWSDLSKISSVSSVFQTPECYDFYNSLSFMQAFAFGVSEYGRLKGVMSGFIQSDGGKIKRFLSRRAIVNGGLLLADDISDDAVGELLKIARRELRKKAIYIETRNFNDYSRWKEVFLKNGFEYVPHFNFHIDTSSEEIIEANLGKSRKRDIRTSLRDGAEVMEEVTLDDVRGFYVMLESLYRTKVKTPLFPLVFFEKLYTSGLGIFRLVRYDNRIVGGTVCVGLPGRSVYEWFVCGEDGIYKNIFPSTLATFAGIKYATKNGYPLFDMMGAGKPGNGYGVRDFKAKFGGNLVEYGRFLCVNSPLLYNIGKLGVKLIKKL